MMMTPTPHRRSGGLLCCALSGHDLLVPLNRDHLLKMLREQLELLDHYCGVFDGGQPIMALPMSTAIRVLVHDTSTSHSVLGQLASKERMSFLDGSEYGTVPSHLPSGALRKQGADPGLVIAFFDYDDGAEFVPIFEVEREPMAPTSFDHWWKDPTMSDDMDHEFSRRNLVLAMANKVGGAHVDRGGLDEAFELITARGSLGYWSTQGRLLASPLPAAIRQIAEELRRAIRAGHADDLDDLGHTPPPTVPDRPPGYYMGGYKVVIDAEGTQHFATTIHPTGFPPDGRTVTLIEGRTDPPTPY